MSITKEQILILVNKLKESKLNLDAVTLYFSENNLFEELLKHFDFIVSNYVRIGYKNDFSSLLLITPSKYLLSFLGEIEENSTCSHQGGWLVDVEETSTDIKEFFKKLAFRILKDFPEKCLNNLSCLRNYWKEDWEAKELLFITLIRFPENIPEEYNSLFEEILAIEKNENLNELQLEEDAYRKSKLLLDEIFK